MEVSEPACLGLQAGWQCRSPHRPWVIQQALKGASRSSQTARLFFVQLCSCSWKSCSSSQDSNPHQGLLCRALAGWSTPLADAVWDLRVWRVLKEVSLTRLYPYLSSPVAIPKSRTMQGKVQLPEGSSNLPLSYLLNQFE